MMGELRASEEVRDVSTAPVIPNWSLGERLAKARSFAGIRTQAEMALRLTAALERPVSDKAVAAWETDRNQPRKMIEVVGAWSHITGVPSDWLLGVREPVKDDPGADLDERGVQMAFRLHSVPVLHDRRVVSLPWFEGDLDGLYALREAC